MKIENKKLLNTIFAQTIDAAVYFNDEQATARRYRALEKAMTNIETNNTIAFSNGILTFVSQTSGKIRKVTKFGCVATACECGNGISYHQELFDLLNTYFALLPKQVVQKSWLNDASHPYLKPTNNKPAERIGGIRIN